MEAILTDGRSIFHRSRIGCAADLHAFNQPLEAACLELDGAPVRWVSCDPLPTTATVLVTTPVEDKPAELPIASLPLASLPLRARVVLAAQRAREGWQERSRLIETRRRDRAELARLMECVMAVTLEIACRETCDEVFDQAVPPRVEPVSALMPSARGVLSLVVPPVTVEVDGLAFRVSPRHSGGSALEVGLPCPECGEPQWVVVTSLEDFGAHLRCLEERPQPCQFCVFADDPFTES